jgi:hypothetical protein
VSSPTRAGNADVPSVDVHSGKDGRIGELETPVMHNTGKPLDLRAGMAGSRSIIRKPALMTALRLR